MLALAAALAGLPVAFAGTAQGWLEDMHDATRHLNYDGVFVYQRGAQLDTMRLVHRYHDDVEQERLISLSGPAREVIRDGTLVNWTCSSTRPPRPSTTDFSSSFDSVS
ncbi:MAG: sigma-E factor regulatory protein RseB domain-containing protein, partial [Gammaproteobacteria bacterium]